MIRVGVVGLGKMGLSHLAILRAHSDVSVDAVIDSSGYLLDVMTKYTGLPVFDDLAAALENTALDSVVIATPTKLHADMVKLALNHGLDVFCEKPLSLSYPESAELVTTAAERQRVTQVGYHNRFVGAFAEVKRLLETGAIGTVTHALAEAYGPVVLKPKGSTWRSRRTEGGGCLYDYAAHPLDLLTWYLGSPIGVGGTQMGGIFSQDTEDEVFSTLYYDDALSAQLSVNWSDESCRKMTTKITMWGTGGRIYADRQECQVYIRDSTLAIPDGYSPGWNVRYTTELTQPVSFYLRGEEYSAQLDYFLAGIQKRRSDGLNSFASAAQTDKVLDLLSLDAAKGPSTRDDAVVGGSATGANPAALAAHGATSKIRRVFSRRSTRQSTQSMGSGA